MSCLINLYVERGQVCQKNASTFGSLKGIEIQKYSTSELEGILLMVIKLVYVRVRTRNLDSKYSPFLTVVSSEGLFICKGSSNEEQSNAIISTPRHMVYKSTALSLTSYYQATGDLQCNLLGQGQESSRLHRDLLCTTRDSVSRCNT